MGGGRVRNPEYAKQVILMRDELGISMTFNPEADAADEIARILLFPSANKVETFANSKVYVVETKIPSSICSMISFLPATAEIGNPLPIPFPKAAISGTTL